ncbi:MAG: outer membrane chaperone Skp [Alphaproteobacteria bacterium HGW-Alphaproteobacteria-2]|nr:MAG: outer membrane chaperone Skp [Alphaproteobacteria bacterium HGW-Alphaproteobacteria-2]
MRPARLASALVLALALGTVAAPVAAQQPQGLPIATLDQERLFAESAFGKRLRAEVEARARELATENRSIEAELTAEERALTERRTVLEPEEFRALAEAFDSKVIAIREAQDRKARDLDSYAENERQRFFGLVLPILVEMMREGGVAVIIEERAIVLSTGAIDLTSAAMTRIDALIGAGDPPPPDDAEPSPADPPARP